MVGRNGEAPERLLASEATNFERRLLTAAAKEAPSPELSLRMAKAIGVSAMTAAATTTVATRTTVAGAATKGVAATWPWIAGGLIGLSVVGVLVAGGLSRPSPPAPPPPQRSFEAAPSTAPPPPAVPVGTDRAARTPASGQNTLQAEIDLLDGARAALSTRSSRRALELVRRYEELYPIGSFLPEATAVRVEALVQLGRDAEARALAQRFIAAHRGSLLSDRVAALAGLPRR